MLRDRYIDVSKVLTHKIPYSNAPKFYTSLLEDRSKALSGNRLGSRLRVIMA